MIFENIKKNFKNPFVFCSFIYSFILCFDKQNLTFNALINYWLGTFVCVLFLIAFYDVLLKENLMNRILKKYDINDIIKIFKESDIKIKEDYFNNSLFMSNFDKEKVLLLLEEIK